MTCLVALLLAVSPEPCELPDEVDLSEAQARAVCTLAEVETPASRRETLLAIYERPGFEQARTPQTQDLLRRLQAWLETLFATAGAETFSNVTRIAVLVAAALAAIAVTVRLSRHPRPHATLASAKGVPRLELSDPALHLDRARTLLAASPREAARQGLLAILSALERQRLARPDRVKTNREIVAELPDRGAPPPLIEAVREQLGWFDRTWYSLEPLDPSVAARFVDAAAALVIRVDAIGGGRAP